MSAFVFWLVMHDDRPKRRIEPLVWLMFSGGGVMAAMFLPVLAFLFALAFPLGWIDPPDHDHLVAVVGHPLTFLVLLGLFVLMLVHAPTGSATRSTTASRSSTKRTVAVLCYGAAAVGAFATVVVVWTV